MDVRRAAAHRSSVVMGRKSSIYDETPISGETDVSVYKPLNEKNNNLGIHPTMSDTNQAIQSQKQARSLKFQIYKEEEVFYQYSENKGADQLHSY